MPGGASRNGGAALFSSSTLNVYNGASLGGSTVMLCWFSIKKKKDIFRGKTFVDVYMTEQHGLIVDLGHPRG